MTVLGSELNKGKAMMDNIDHRLIGALRKDPRQKMVGLAREVGLSRTATQNRLNRLLDSKTIIGFDVVLNNDKDKMEFISYLLVEFAKGSNKKTTINQIVANNSIMSCHSLAGNPDLLIGVECPDRESLAEAVNKISEVPGVDRVCTHIVLSTHVSRRKRSADSE